MYRCAISDAASAPFILLKWLIKKERISESPPELPGCCFWEEQWMTFKSPIRDFTFLVDLFLEEVQAFFHLPAMYQLRRRAVEQQSSRCKFLRNALCNSLGLSLCCGHCRESSARPNSCGTIAGIAWFADSTVLTIASIIADTIVGKWEPGFSHDAVDIWSQEFRSPRWVTSHFPWESASLPCLLIYLCSFSCHPCPSLFLFIHIHLLVHLSLYNQNCLFPLISFSFIPDVKVYNDIATSVHAPESLYVSSAIFSILHGKNDAGLRYTAALFICERICIQLNHRIMAGWKLYAMTDDAVPHMW